MTLLDRLSTRFPTAKRTTLRRMIDDGRVTVNGTLARLAKHDVQESDTIAVAKSTPDSEPIIKPVDLPFDIVFEDRDVIVINKPAGLLTSTVPNEKRPTAWSLLRDAVRAREPRTHVALIHRLDRDASGLLIFSKNSKAYESLKLQFREHSVGRTYTAVVYGTPKPGKDRIKTRLVERPDGKVVSTPNPEAGEEAISDYETIRTVGQYSVVRVDLHTGRKNQIRAHLSERGHPIVGDSVYGTAPRPTRTRGPELMLAATKLVFTHPISLQRMRFQADLPEHVRTFLAGVRKETGVRSQ